MKKNSVGNILMTFAVVLYTFPPLLADLASDTHIFHPEWVPHARVHGVWLLGLTTGIGLFALYLLWFSKIDSSIKINIAGALSLIVYGSFFLSMATTGLYGGAINAHVTGEVQTILGLSPNTFVFLLATILLSVGWGICRSSRSE